MKYSFNQDGTQHQKNHILNDILLFIIISLLMITFFSGVLIYTLDFNQILLFIHKLIVYSLMFCSISLFLLRIFSKNSKINYKKQNVSIMGSYFLLIGIMTLNLTGGLMMISIL